MSWKEAVFIVIMGCYIQHVSSSDWLLRQKEDFKLSLKAEILTELKSELKEMIHDEIKEITGSLIKECSKINDLQDNEEEENHHALSICDNIKVFVKQQIRQELEGVLGSTRSNNIETGSSDGDQSQGAATGTQEPREATATDPNNQAWEAYTTNMHGAGVNTEMDETDQDPEAVSVSTERDSVDDHGQVAGRARNDREAGSVFTSTAGRGRSDRAAGSVSRRRSSSPQSVAFTAYLDHPYTAVGAQTVIKFNRALLNEGHGYNVYTGMFTAPVAGIYLFSFHFSSAKSQTNLQLLVDGQPQVAAVSGNSGIGDQGGCLAVLKVNAGQAIWVETYGDHPHDVFSSDYMRETSFAGVFLYSI